MFLGIAGFAAAALLTACTGKTTPPAPPSHPATSPVSATTATKTFSPYNAEGVLTAATSTAASGNCWTTSIALPGATDYRCMAGNQILDPCFAPPHVTAPKTVACFTDPWSPGVLLTLTAALPSPDAATRSTPWALELSDGTHCVAITGTVDQVGDLDLGYSCGGSAEAALVGTAGTAWSVQYRASDDQPLHSVAVSTAWH
jgi:hypothetical protein